MRFEAEILALTQNLFSESNSTIQKDPPGGCVVVLVVVIAMLTANWFWSSYVESIHLTPWVNHEQLLHDNLSSSLLNNQGFELDFNNNDWVQKYSQKNAQGKFDWIFSVDATGDTTAYFPAIPALNAIFTKLFSIESGALYCLTSFLLALAVALLVDGMRRWFGWPAALITIVTVLCDISLQGAPLLPSGEGLFAAFTLLAFVTLIQSVNAQPDSRATVWKLPIAGALLGATTLFSASSSVWLVFMLTAWVGYVVIQLIRRQPLERTFEAFALFSIGILVVAAPWWIRNCKTTGQFKPLGNSIQMNMVGAYSDSAILGSGNLDPTFVFSHREKVMMTLNSSDMPLAKKESVVAESSVAKARQWASENSAKIFQLTLQKIANHFSLLGQSSPLIAPLNSILIIGAMIGIFACWPRFGMYVLALLVASTVVTALTWSDHGRLLIPLRPLLHACFAIGIVRMFGLGVRQ